MSVFQLNFIILLLLEPFVSLSFPGLDLINNDGTDLSKARVVMSALEHIATASELIASVEDIAEMSGAQTEALFIACYTHLVDKFLADKVSLCCFVLCCVN